LISIIKSELYKFSKRKSLKLLISIFFIFIFSSAIYKNFKPYDPNWKDTLINLNKEYESQLNSELGVVDSLEEIFKNNINYNNYLIKNNINPNIETTWKFIHSTSSFSLIIIIYIIILSSENISKENSNGTLSLILTRPYKRYEICLSKFMSLIILGIFLFLYLTLISFFIGIIFWGIKGLNLNYIDSINYTNVNLPIIHVILFNYLGYLFSLIIYTIISFLISVIFNKESISSLLSIILLLFGGTISTFLKEFSWYKYTLFSNLDLSIYMGRYSETINNLTFSETILKHFIYILIFLFATLYLFNKKEIKTQ
jgi:ABC-2 type transport system permease protein